MKINRGVRQTSVSFSLTADDDKAMKEFWEEARKPGVGLLEAAETVAAKQKRALRARAYKGEG